MVSALTKRPALYWPLVIFTGQYSHPSTFLRLPLGWVLMDKPLISGIHLGSGEFLLYEHVVTKRQKGRVRKILAGFWGSGSSYGDHKSELISPLPRVTEHLTCVLLESNK